MKITIHRGTNEIGGNCVEITTANGRIIIDVGMPLFKSVGKPYDTGILKKMPKEELLESGVLPVFLIVYRRPKTRCHLVVSRT